MDKGGGGGREVKEVWALDAATTTKTTPKAVLCLLSLWLEGF